MAVNIPDICGRGYFPQEIPPAFSSIKFASYAATIPAPAVTPPRTEGVNFNLARAGGLRRRLTIPNPQAFLSLTSVIVANWSAMNGVYQRSPVPSSYPDGRSRTRNRALPPTLWFPKRAVMRARLRSRARFVLAGDLSQCYSSIYTHSFAWALAGKVAAKAGALSHTTVPGDDLDKASCRLQLGQTKGIPVGPDTSLALAELILCSIDIEFGKRLATRIRNGRLSALRISDDFEYFASSRGEAEDALLCWETAAAYFELQINPLKTEILELPQTLQELWPTTLTQFHFRTTTPKTLISDLYAFFSLAHGLAAQHRTAPIIKYAIRRVIGIRQVFSDRDVWKTFLELLLPSIIAEPSALDVATSAIIMADSLGLPVDSDGIAGTLSEIVLHHAPLEHGAEVAWALYVIARLGLPLEAEPAKKVATMEDNVALVLLHCLLSKGLVQHGAPADLSLSIVRAEAPEAVHTSDWLLAYELAFRRWANDAEVRAVPWFRAMLDASVNFFTCPPGGVSAPPPGLDSDEDEEEDAFEPDDLDWELWERSSL